MFDLSCYKKNHRSKVGNKLRKKILEKFNGLCGYCGKHKATVIDHISPCIAGGRSNEENLMPACASCNNFKHVWSIEEFRKELGMQLERARKRSINFRMLERFGTVTINEAPIVFYFEVFKDA